MGEKEEYFRELILTLKKLKRVKIEKIPTVIENLTKTNVKGIEDLAFNILKGQIPLPDSLREKASANKDLYKQLTAKKTPIAERRQLLQNNPRFTRSLALIGLEALDTEDVENTPPPPVM